MTNSNTKGDRNERKFTRWLYDNGWAVMRAPASGSATQRELPDVLAGNTERFYAMEVKSSGGDPIYVDAQEVADLRYFARAFGASARLAVSFDTEHGDPAYGENRPGVYILSPESCHVTDTGKNYRIKKELALEQGVPEVEL